MNRSKSVVAVMVALALGILWVTYFTSQQPAEYEDPSDPPLRLEVVESSDVDPAIGGIYGVDVAKDEPLAELGGPPPTKYEDPPQEFEAADQLFKQWADVSLPGVTEEHWDVIEERIEELDEVAKAYQRVWTHYREDGVGREHGLEWLLGSMVRTGQAHSEMVGEIYRTMESREQYDEELVHRLHEEFVDDASDTAMTYFERGLEIAGTYQLESRWVEQIFDEVEGANPDIGTQWLSDYPEMTSFVVDYYEERCTDDHRHCVRLGWLLQRGEYVEAEPERALSLFDESCEAGAPEACIELAWAYEQGAGVERDEARGQELLEYACDELNSVEACVRLDGGEVPDVNGSTDRR